MDVFTMFTTSDYTFLELDSKASGNVIIQEYNTNGIVKLRDGMIQTDNVEAYESTASVHIRPSEPFIASLDGNLVGHGIRIQKDANGPQEYRIEGQVEGYDYNIGKLEFIRVTLKRERISTWPSDLPLE